jgi:hypothetical protein
MSINKSKLDQIELEFKSGLVTKAISRLEGLSHNNPNEILYREKLAEIYFSVNWLEKAGENWYLTSRTHFKIKSIELFEKQNGSSATQILTVLKFRGDVEKLPKDLKTIYRNLESESLKINGYVPTYSLGKKQPHYKATESTNDKLFTIGCISVIALIIIFTIIGFIAFLKWII